MAKLYAGLASGVRVTFCLNVRRTPCPLLAIQQQVGCPLPLPDPTCTASPCSAAVMGNSCCGMPRAGWHNHMRPGAAAHAHCTW